MLALNPAPYMHIRSDRLSILELVQCPMYASRVTNVWPSFCLLCCGCIRYRTELGLDAETTKVLTEDLATALYYEQALAAGGDAKEAAKWLTGTSLVNFKHQVGLSERLDKIALVIGLGVECKG